MVALRNGVLISQDDYNSVDQTGRLMKEKEY